MQYVAACDVHAKRLNEALDRVNGHYHNSDCKTYHDFRELLARTDIDAVHSATPDHWHIQVVDRGLPARQGRLLPEAGDARRCAKAR